MHNARAIGGGLIPDNVGVTLSDGKTGTVEIYH